jgi:hypothetical protein
VYRVVHRVLVALFEPVRNSNILKRLEDSVTFYFRCKLQCGNLREVANLTEFVSRHHVCVMAECEALYEPVPKTGSRDNDPMPC